MLVTQDTRDPAANEVDRIRPEGLDDLDTAAEEAFCICRILSDPQGHPVDYEFLRISDNFRAVTGLGDVVGKAARQVIPDIDPGWIATCARVARGGASARFRLASKPPGRIFEVLAVPLDPQGHFTIIFHDATDPASMEDQRNAARAEVETLRHEFGHRVMNSLSMIVSIVNLEARSHTNDSGRHALRRVSNRVQAIARLYKSLVDNVTRDDVDADDYLRGLVKTLISTMPEARKLQFRMDIAPVALSSQLAVQLGLVVNELVFEAIKRERPAAAAGSIRLSFSVTDHRCTLLVEDDGVTPPAKPQIGDSDAAASPAEAGIGRQLVGALLQQLGGSLDVQSGLSGTCVTLSFPDDRNAR